MQLGLTLPSGGAPAPQQLNIGGLLSMKPLSTLLAEDATAAAASRASEVGNQPVVQGLVGLVQKHWGLAKSAKQTIEQDMLEAVRARAGRYSAAMEADLRLQGGSAIYMMLFATKARQSKALLSDVMIGTGAEKPWTMASSPVPSIPEEDKQKALQGVAQMVQQAEQAGAGMDMEAVTTLLRDAKERMEADVMQRARDEARECETQMEDVLAEGGYLEAMDEFLDDLTTFKTAFMKGPIVRNEAVLEWKQGPDGKSTAEVTTVKKLRYERVDPFMMYPVPWAKNTDDAPLIERHKLSRGDLSAMIDVDGYSADAIRAALDQHGSGGLREWLAIDSEKDAAEGRENVTTGSDELIDALQYWGSVSGKMLREWGMKDLKDDAKEYPVECWLVGEHVIKCVINSDPLARRPYYSDGYSRIPGAFWHNSLYDLIKDVCAMCNSAARALANNMGLSSGPQVGLNIDRMAPGEKPGQMFPWKIWQFNNDPMGNGGAPITFFQPQSNAAELMGVYDKFGLMADEYSGIPRYMTGTEGTPGAGRTASGLSMMVGNASKVIKSLVGSIDIRITRPLLKRLFDWKMQHDDTFNYRGDINIIPRGALSLQVKEAANQARMQFMQMTLNPLDSQLMGPEGRIALLREAAKNLNMNPDSVVPSVSKMRLRQIAMQQAQAGQPPPQPGHQGGPTPEQTGNPSGQTLSDGRPVTDNVTQ